LVVTPHLVKSRTLTSAKYEHLEKLEKERKLRTQSPARQQKDVQKRIRERHAYDRKGHGGRGEEMCTEEVTKERGDLTMHGNRTPQ